MFFCWRDNCSDANFSKPLPIFTAKWSGAASKHEPLVRVDAAFNYILTHPRVFIINERQLNLTERTTWTTARNILFERALAEERHQGWHWAYYNFCDGDIRTTCPLTKSLLNTSHVNEDGLVIAVHFRSLISIQQHLTNKAKTNQCFILMDAFLLSVSPAIGVVAGMGAPILFDGLLTQIVYHIDAIFNAFHRDALSFILPYCSRYDKRSWWSSQAILVFRSLCLYGHVIQFNGVHITAQKHREYPRNGDPWQIDRDMNLVPRSLTSLQTYMKSERIVSALILRHYGGWSLAATSDECRHRHTSVNPVNCTVSGGKIRQKS
ncbi:unnamed protein product [Rotaria sordida]|uniref:Uncharacterized protein n=3 Tax=Rotaria sordida TaxID=392033 RepID=A0A815GX01_9BILA|nr:unnamed protein product [Rotaria sordida]